MKSAEDVRAIIVALLAESPTSHGVTLSSLADETDLRQAGLVDSLGFMLLLEALSDRLGTRIDVSGLDPAHLTRLGALARHISSAIHV